MAVQQVPQSGHRRRGAADPAPQRLQDQQPDRAGPHRARGAGAVPARLRLDAAISWRATTRKPMHQADGRRRSDEAIEAHPADPGRGARQRRHRRRPRWPMIVLQLAQGLDGTEGRRRPADRGHVPLPPGAAAGRRRPSGALRQLESWMKSYRPEELFDERRPPAPGAGRARPQGRRGGWAPIPHANGGMLLRDLRMPDFRDYALDVPAPGRDRRRRTRGCWASSCGT